MAQSPESFNHIPTVSHTCPPLIFGAQADINPDRQWTSGQKNLSSYFSSMFHVTFLLVNMAYYVKRIRFLDERPNLVGFPNSNPWRSLLTIILALNKHRLTCRGVHIKANVNNEWLKLEYYSKIGRDFLDFFSIFKLQYVFTRKTNTHQPASVVWGVKEGCDAVKKTTQLCLCLLCGASLILTLYESAQL